MGTMETKNQWLTRLVRTYDATVPDLQDFGLTQHSARMARDQIGQHVLQPLDHVVVPPPPAGSDLITIVPSNSLAAKFWAMGCYLRADSLRGRVRLAASYVATDQSGHLVIRPITRRVRIGSVAALAGVGGGLAGQVCHESGAVEGWPRPTGYFELGDLLPFSLPVGYAPNPMNAMVTSAIRGIVNVRLADVETAVRNGGTLASVPKPAPVWTWVD